MPKTITQIEIKRKQKAKKDTQRPVDLAPLPRKIGRRRLTDDKKWLNVYDVHRLANGADRSFTRYVELMLDFGPGPGDQRPYYTPFSNGLFGGNGSINAGGIEGDEAATVADWNNYVLPTTADDLVLSRMKITHQLDDYGITFDGLGLYTVEAKGIEIPENVVNYKGSTGSPNSILWQMDGQPNFPAWIDRTLTSSPSLATKITKLPSYAAASEPLVVDRSIDVFLAPAYFGSSGFSRARPFTNTTFPYLPQTWFFNLGVGQVLSRSVTLNNPSWDEMWGHVLSNTIQSSAPNDVKDYLYSVFFADPGSTYTLTATSHVHPGPTLVTDTSAGGAVLRYPNHNNRMFSVSSSYYEGTLMALIRKHLGDNAFEWYYVWTATFWNGNGINPHPLGGFTGGVFDF